MQKLAKLNFVYDTMKVWYKFVFYFGCSKTYQTNIPIHLLELSSTVNDSQYNVIMWFYSAILIAFGRHLVISYQR